METGREQMERSFRSLLTRNSSPVAAETILAKLSASEGTVILNKKLKLWGFNLRIDLYSKVIIFQSNTMESIIKSTL